MARGREGVAWADRRADPAKADQAARISLLASSANAANTGEGKRFGEGRDPGRRHAVPFGTPSRKGRARRARAPGRNRVDKVGRRAGLGRVEGRAAAGGSGTRAMGRRQGVSLGPLGKVGPGRRPGTGLSGVSGERAGPLGRACKAGHPRKNPENRGDSTGRLQEGRAGPRSRPRQAKSPGKRLGWGSAPGLGAAAERGWAPQAGSGERRDAPIPSWASRPRPGGSASLNGSARSLPGSWRGDWFRPRRRKRGEGQDKQGERRSKKPAERGPDGMRSAPAGASKADPLRAPGDFPCAELPGHPAYPS